MADTFFKYHSLGNDFVLFDRLGSDIDEIKELALSARIKQICDRHRGVGADGVLFIFGDYKTGSIKSFIFNADGTPGGLCLNGARCIMQHVFSRYDIDRSATFSLLMGDRVIHNLCDGIIKQYVPLGVYSGDKTIVVDSITLTGAVVDVGNPHFIVLDSSKNSFVSNELSIDWLLRYGAMIERHDCFPNRTNVELVWPLEDSGGSYKLIVYERGCGITQACSSAVVALATLLYHRGEVATEEAFTVNMLGGHVVATVVDGNSVQLEASAAFVFRGEIA